MAAITNILPQFFDNDGSPLNEGRIYIGLPNLPTKQNLVKVYADVNLQTELPQPLSTQNGLIVSAQKAVVQVYPATINMPVSVIVEDFAGVEIYNAPNVDISAFSAKSNLLALSNLPDNSSYKLVLAPNIIDPNGNALGISNLSYSPSTRTLSSPANVLNISGNATTATTATKALTADNQPITDNSDKVANTAYVNSFTSSQLSVITKYIGRTWKNVTNQRSAGVDYTNSSSVPIEVIISGSSTDAGGLVQNLYFKNKASDTAYLDVLNRAQVGTGYFFAMELYCTVPPGGVYKYTGNVSTVYELSETPST